MGIWGKIVGGAAGLVMGGPIGALIGAVAGHAVDTMSKGPEPAETPEAATSQIAFTIGVIALGAKMAKADGVVTRDEIAAFKEMFQVHPDEMRNVARIFDAAKRDSRGFELYARQLRQLLAPHPHVLEQVLASLAHIARADGRIDPAETEYLARVAEIFGFGPADIDRILAQHGMRAEDDPYHILGVDRGMGDDEIKAVYRRLMRENHPDRLIADGLPEEAVALANEKVAVLNGAWDKITKERGIR